MTNVPIPKGTELVTPKEIAIEFLGGFIDREDLSEGPFPLYTGLRSYKGFALNEERVGFAGAFGIQDHIYPATHEGRIVLVLWPRMPERDTQVGYTDVFDPDPVLELTWHIERLIPDGTPRIAHHKCP